MKMTAKERGQLQTFLNAIYEFYKITRRDYLLMQVMDKKDEFEVNDIIKINNALVFLEKITDEDTGKLINQFKASLLAKTSLNSMKRKTSRKAVSAKKVKKNKRK
jgi:hypothetical protein